MTRYRVTFARVGRRHSVPPLITEAGDTSQLVRNIHDYAGQFLMSREYNVSLHPDCGGFLDGGRLGTFTVHALATDEEA